MSKTTPTPAPSSLLPSLTRRRLIELAVCSAASLQVQFDVPRLWRRILPANLESKDLSGCDGQLDYGARYDSYTALRRMGHPTATTRNRPRGT